MHCDKDIQFKDHAASANKLNIYNNYYVRQVFGQS